ncbi:hypothetical protein CRUP_029377, partial [Coryphaenoides rupestris]
WGCDLRRGGADDFRDCMKDLQEQVDHDGASCVGPVTFDLVVMMVLDCTRDRQEQFAPEVCGPETAQHFLGCLSETRPWTVLGPPGWLLLWQKVARLTSWCYISTSGHQFQVLDTSVGPVTFDLVVMMVLDCTRDRQEQVSVSQCQDLGRLSGP